MSKSKRRKIEVVLFNPWFWKDNRPHIDEYYQTETAISVNEWKKTPAGLLQQLFGTEVDDSDFKDWRLYCAVHLVDQWVFTCRTKLSNRKVKHEVWLQDGWVPLEHIDENMDEM